MAAGPRAGRGRGMLVNREQKPGITADFGLKADSEPRASPMEHLSLLIDNMSHEFIEIEVEPLTLAFTEAVKSKEEMNDAVQMLISRCLKDQTFAPCAVEVFLKLGNIAVEDLSCRKAFLSLLNTTFKQKEELRKERPQTKWLGCVALLAQVVSKMRLPDNSPMLVIVQASLDSLLCCLEHNSTDDELECASVQIQKILEDLIKYGRPDNVAKLQDTIYNIIISGRGSKDVRKKFIEIVELLSNRPK